MNGLASALPPAFAVGITICLTVILVTISVIDLKTLRIPDLLSLPLIAAGLTLAVAAPGVDAKDHLAGALGAYILFAGLGEVYFRSRGIDGLGLGDAKLFAAAGAWLGWQNLPIVLLIATAGGLIYALLRSGLNQTARIAFGPFLALAFWVVWVWAVYSENMV
jgi:leader peptidase (prepilin peptidase) / N-methyltransferase